MVVSTRWGGLRIEPYKVNPKDADLDGIVQEGTIWERPDGTVIVDLVGRLIPDGAPGRNLEDRGTVFIVDRNGNRVDYKPSWAGKPLSLGERQSTLGQSVGTIGDVAPTVGDIDGTLVNPPDPEAVLAKRQSSRRQEAFITALRDLEDDDLDKYIARLERKERRNTLDADNNEGEWLAAARALKNERDEKKKPTEKDDLTPIVSPDGWEETPENAKANKETDNLNQPDVSDAEVVEEVTAYDWKEKRKERKEETKARLRRLYDKIWKRDSEDEPWLLPDPEDEDGMPIDIDSDEPDQIWNAMSKAQQDEWLEKMFLVGKEIDLGEVRKGEKKYRLTAMHELSDTTGIDRGRPWQLDGDVDIIGRWVFRVYDSYGNEVYNSNSNANPTAFGDHRNGGTARGLLVNDKTLIMNYLGTDHKAEFFDNEGNPIEIEFNQLDESLAQIFNDNAFMFATQLGIEKAGLEAVDKGQVVWAAQGYDPAKNSYSTIANLKTVSNLIDAWETVEALRRAGTLDPNNLEHAKLIVAASVLGDRERYLRVKGILSGIDISKLPATTEDLMNTIYAADDVDRVLAEAGTSFEEIPKAGDLLHALLPDGKLRDNVLAFNMWRGGEGASGLTGSERRLAIEQADVPELDQAMTAIMQQEGQHVTGGIAMWNIMEEPVTPLISASGEQDLNTFVPFGLDLWGKPPAPKAPQSVVDPTTIHDADRVFYTEAAGEISNSIVVTDSAREKFIEWTGSVLERLKKGPRRTDIAEMERFENPQLQEASTTSLMILSGILERIARGDGELNNLSDDQLMLLLQLELDEFRKKSKDPNLALEIDDLTFKDGRWLNYMGQNITPLVSQLIVDARQHERNGIEIEEAISEPIDAAQGVSGAIAVVTDNEEAKTIITKAFSFLDKYLGATGQGDGEGKRIPIVGHDKMFNFYAAMSARLRDTLTQDSSEDEGWAMMGLGGLMSMAAIFQGGRATKKAEVDIEAFTRNLRTIRNDPNLTPAEMEIAISKVVERLVDVTFHEYAHALDYKHNPKNPKYRDTGNFAPVSRNAIWALIRDLQEKGEISAGADLKEILAKPHLFAALLTDENIKGKRIARIGQALGISDPDALEAYRPMLMYLKKLYETDTGKALLRLSADERPGAGDRVRYYGSPNEMLARFAAQSYMLRIFRENGLIYNFRGLSDAERADAELQNERVLENVDPEIRILYLGAMMKYRQSNEDLLGNRPNTGEYSDEINFSGNGELVQFSIEEVDQVDESFDSMMSSLGVLNDDYVPTDPNTSLLADISLEGSPRSVPLATASNDQIEELYGDATSLSVAQITEKLRLLVTPRKSVLTKGKEIENTLVMESGQEEVPIPSKVLNRTFGAIANFMKPVINRKGTKIEKIKVLGSPLREDHQGAFNPKNLYIKLSNALSTLSNPKNRREMPLTLLHEYGHAYDYQNFPNGRSKVTLGKIFNSAALRDVLEKINFRSIFNADDDLDTDMDESLDAIIKKGNLENGMVVELPKSPWARLLGAVRDSGTAGDDDTVDEVNDMFAAFNKAGVRLTPEQVKEVVAENLELSRNLGITMHGWLYSLNDKDTEKVIQDLPEAMQPRARLMVFLARSSSGKTLFASLKSFTHDMDNVDGINQKFGLYVQGILEGRIGGSKANKEKLIKEIRALVEGLQRENPKIRKRAMDILWNKFAVWRANNSAHLKYVVSPEEQWARAVEQTTQLKAIIDLCDGDADAARLVLDIIDNDDDILRTIKLTGKAPADAAIFNIIRENNPDLYDAAMLYASRYMLLGKEDNRLQISVSYIADLSQAFEAVELVEAVVYSDGMSPVDEVTAAGLHKLKSTLPLPKTPEEKKILRETLMSNFDTFVKTKYPDTDPEVFQYIIPDHFMRLIPDGKLDAYIEAFDDDDVDKWAAPSGDIVMEMLLQEKARRRDLKGEGKGYINNWSFFATDPLDAQDRLTNPSGRRLSDVSTQATELFDSPAPASLVSLPDAPPISKDNITTLDNVKKKISKRRQNASISYFNRLSKRVESFVSSRANSRRNIFNPGSPLTSEEKKRKELLSTGDKGVVSWLKEFGAGRGAAVMGKAQEGRQSRIKEWLSNKVNRTFLDELKDPEIAKESRITDSAAPLTRMQARALLKNIKSKGYPFQTHTRPYLKLEGSRRAGRKLRKDLNTKLDKAIADGDTEEAERITGIINYIESFGFREASKKNNLFGRLVDDYDEAFKMEDPYHVFVSDMNSNWQVSSALPLMQIAQAELLGWDREEIIDRIFWLADEEDREEIRKGLEAMDNGKRVSIDLVGYGYNVIIEGDDGKPVISSLQEALDERLERREAYVKRQVDQNVRLAEEGRLVVDDIDLPMYEGGYVEDALEDFEDVPIPDDEEMASVTLTEEQLEEQIKIWTKEAEDAFDELEPLSYLQKDWEMQEKSFADIERALSRDGLEAAKLGLQMQKQEFLDELKRAGVTHVTLYRGVGLEDEGLSAEDILRSRTSPLSSWAFSPFVAQTFSKQGDKEMIMMEAAVPIEAIAGSSLTGFGAFHEDEVVVIAEKIDPSAVVTHIGNDAIAQIGDDAMRELMAGDPTTLITGIGEGEKVGATISEMDDESLIDSFTGKTLNELIEEGIEEAAERTQKENILNEASVKIFDEAQLEIHNYSKAFGAVDPDNDEYYARIDAINAAAKRRREAIIRQLDPEGTYELVDPVESRSAPVGVDSPESLGSPPATPVSEERAEALRAINAPIATEQVVPTNPRERQELDDEGYPRFERGYFEKTIAVFQGEPAPEIAEKLQVDKDWSEVTVDPEKTSVVSAAYQEAAEVTKKEMTEEARVAWTALATEVEDQYALATKAVEEGGLGITIEYVDSDPYANFAEMWEDYTKNGRVKILRTEATGGHPFFTNEQNDKFRAVHDIFGHLATGRGFDRNGEEAAYQAHVSMFGPDATKAAATELRGQNSVLLETGDFPPQKLIILPEDMRKSLARWAIGILTKVLEPTKLSSEAQRQNDADNAYMITRSHHVSCGRYIV